MYLFRCFVVLLTFFGLKSQKSHYFRDQKKALRQFLELFGKKIVEVRSFAMIFAQGRAL